MLAKFDFKYDEPIICAAIHNGHELSEKVKENIAISKKTQLYEEDPFTARFTKICNNRIIVNTSRFEVDLNRSREKSVYKLPKDAWGLNVWKNPPSNEIINVTSEKYRKFYKILKLHLSEMQQKFGKFFVYDIHSYNYRRGGKNTESNTNDPEIILGTNNMPGKWMPLVDKVQNDLQKFDFFDRNLDVRINVKFSGGNFSRWIHRNFPDSACCIAIEFKKIFMDEWTGKLDEQKLIQLRESLTSTLPGIKNNLEFPGSH